MKLDMTKRKLKASKTWCVCEIDGGYLKKVISIISMTFYNPATQKYAELEFDSDGCVFITAPRDTKTKGERG